MSGNYFHRVVRRTPTRLWLNNPTGADMDRALAAGAISGTTNPSYCSKLLQNEPDYILGIIDEVVREVDDDDEAADLVYQRAAARFMNRFLPLYERSKGKEGFVTIQDDPRRDEDAGAIIEASLRHSRLGENYMAKIPVTVAGMEAMASLVERNIPITATECFSISQTVAMCELYRNASHKSGKRPPFFITHITGIYDEALKDYAARRNVDIAPELLDQAGCIVARKEYKVLKERGYETTMLSGGARGTHHFTELVGGDVHVTLNWSTIEELIEADGEVVRRIDAEAPEDVVRELTEKLPDFRRAYHEDALSPEQFSGFAPLQRFRNSFLKGYGDLLSAVAESRR